MLNHMTREQVIACHDRMIELHKKGVPPAAIALRFGCTTTTVSNVLKKAGITPHFKATISLSQGVSLHYNGYVSRHAGLGN